MRPARYSSTNGLHHGFLEALLEIHNVVGHAQVLRHALGVVHVVQRAAALAVRAAAVEFRQPALVPELHGQPDDGEPRSSESRRRRSYPRRRSSRRRSSVAVI